MGRTEWRALWRLLRDQQSRLIFGVVLLGLQAVTLLPITLLVHNIFATQILASDSRAVLLSGLGILGLYCTSTAFSLGARRLLLSSLFEAVATLRLQVLTRLHELPLAWHEHQDGGDLHAALVLGGDRLENRLPSLVALLQAIVVGVPLMIVAIIVSPALAGVVALVTPAILLLNVKLKGRTEQSIKHWIATHHAYDAQVRRMLRSIRLIRTRGVDAVELEESGRHVTALARNGLAKSWAANSASVANGTIAGIVGCVILVVGGVGVTGDVLTLSQLLTFYAVIALIIRNVTAAAGSRENLMIASASLIPLQKIIDDPCPPVYSGTGQMRFDGSVTLMGVTFGYGASPVLREIDFAINAGERVAVVGRNGSGKSTLARLVLGLDRPWTGTVIASGSPLAEIDLAALRRRIGVVPQESFIRSGTIRENITFGRPDLTEADVARALSLAGITEMLDHRFPEGIDADVGDNGARLSGGQRQAISIARALVGDPPLLILDEPSNHLDVHSIRRLLAAVEAMDPPPAVVLITHDQDLAAWADRQVRIEDGRVYASQPMVRSA